MVLLRQTWEVPFILRTAATRPELEYWLKETPEYRKATPTNRLQRAWAELNAACYLETIKTEVGRTDVLRKIYCVIFGPRRDKTLSNRANFGFRPMNRE